MLFAGGVRALDLQRAVVDAVLLEVVLDGGSLFITVNEDKSIFMRGPAAFVYEGDTNIC